MKFDADETRKVMMRHLLAMQEEVIAAEKDPRALASYKLQNKLAAATVECNLFAMQARAEGVHHMMIAQALGAVLGRIMFGVCANLDEAAALVAIDQFMDAFSAGRDGNHPPVKISPSTIGEA